MKTILFLVALGGTYGIAHDAIGLSFGWSTGIAWAVAIVVAIIARRLAMYREYARYVADTPEYRENERRATEFFGLDRE
jgi:hypothetical protein